MLRNHTLLRHTLTSPAPECAAWVDSCQDMKPSYGGGGGGGGGAASESAWVWQEEMWCELIGPDLDLILDDAVAQAALCRLAS